MIRASPSQAPPPGTSAPPVNVNSPQVTLTPTLTAGIHLHQVPESVIQDRRELLTVNSRDGIPAQNVSSDAATSCASQPTVAILEKVLTSTNSTKPDPTSQPQDLSNRFRPIERSGFDSDPSRTEDGKLSTDRDPRVQGVGGEQEGLLLRANNAAVMDRRLPVSQHSCADIVPKSEPEDNKEDVKIEVASLASSFISGTSTGAVFITSQPTDGQLGVSVSDVSQSVTAGTRTGGAGGETTWEQQQHQQQNPQPPFHWSQLVPLITTPNRSSLSNQQPPKNEMDTKPTVNGDILTNGKEPTDSTSEVSGRCGGETGQNQRKSISNQDMDFDFSVDDDDVFVSDHESAPSVTTKSGRSHSLGSCSGKEEPKSPRKVCLPPLRALT